MRADDDTAAPPPSGVAPVSIPAPAATPAATDTLTPAMDLPRAADTAAPRASSAKRALAGIVVVGVALGGMMGAAAIGVSHSTANAPQYHPDTGLPTTLAAIHLPARPAPPPGDLPPWPSAPEPAAPVEAAAQPGATAAAQPGAAAQPAGASAARPANAPGAATGAIASATPAAVPAASAPAADPVAPAAPAAATTTAAVTAEAPSAAPTATAAPAATTTAATRAGPPPLPRALLEATDYEDDPGLDTRPAARGAHAVPAANANPSAAGGATPAPNAPAPARPAAVAAAPGGSNHGTHDGLHVTAAGTVTGYINGRAISLEVVMVEGSAVERHTAEAYQRMRSAALRANVHISINSGFRTMEHQRALYAAYRAGRGNLAALPGHSEHQSGHALDLNTIVPTVRAWMEAHAREFGFRRTVPSEHWHWEHW